MNDTMGNIDRALPAHAAICGTAKFAGRAGKVGRPKLVLKSMTRAGGLINRKPLLISSTCPWKTRPRLAAVSRLPIVVAKVVPQKGIIEKRPYLVCTQNRIAAENVSSATRRETSSESRRPWYNPSRPAGSWSSPN